MSDQSTLGAELAKVLHRKRRAFRFTQADLGRRIDVSGSYISGIENGKSSPRMVELEGLATHFRTTAFELIQEAHQAGQQYVPATSLETGGPSLDEIAAELTPAMRRMARDFLLFLREREKVDTAAE
jgi:transcriptional regulator with XRE-family HTH domain